ncbi:MAG: DNA internalization-related competence protein ComEC/Rec2, partial [Desulfatitalea sp.]
MAMDTHAVEAIRSSTFLRPLIPAVVALIVGILAGGQWPGFFGGGLAAAGLLALAVLWYAFHRRTVLVLPLLFCALCGYLSIQPWLKNQMPPDHVVHYVDHGKWQVTGVVAEPPEGEDGKGHFILDAAQLTQGERRIAVRGQIRVSVRGPMVALARGDRVILSGHLRAIRSFCNFGGFDYERFMALQGVRVRLYTQGEQVRRETSAQGGWQARLDRVRASLGQRMAESVRNHPPATIQLLVALTLGVREGISADLNQAFSRAGVTHVIAISGLNIGMVAMCAFAMCMRLLVWIPPLTQRAWVRKSAAALSLLPVVGYCLLAGMSPSVQRAMIMCMAFLLTFWIGRRHDMLNSLAVAALLILIISPPDAWSISFQLSFGSVLAIILGMKAIPIARADGSQAMGRRWGLRLAALAAVSMWAILGTTPLVMRYFNQVCWVGPLTNLVVVPLAGLVIPAGLLGIVLAPFSNALAWLCWQAAAFGLDGLVLLVETVARWPWAASTAVTPSLLEIGVFYLLLGVLLFGKGRAPRIIGLALCIIVGGADAAYWLHRRFGTERLTVTAVDVGQGGANLLQLPGGFTVLIDGGGFGDNSAFDVGRSVVAPMLWRHKIKTIDRVILSHPNSDHLNGLLFILNHFSVGEVWSNHETAEAMGYRQWRQTIAERGIRHVEFDQLPRHSDQSGVTFDILGPPDDFLQRRAVERWRDENNNSLVVRVAWKEVAFLFSGDIMTASEAELVARHGAQGVQSTVLLVPHHGSRGSSSIGFLRAVHPRESIIS